MVGVLPNLRGFRRAGVAAPVDAARYVAGQIGVRLQSGLRGGVRNSWAGDAPLTLPHELR